MTEDQSTDTTKSDGTGSNSPARPTAQKPGREGTRASQPQAPELEARILEEIIIAPPPARKPEKQPVAPAQEAELPAPPRSTSPQPPAPPPPPPAPIAHEQKGAESPPPPSREPEAQELSLPPVPPAQKEEARISQILQETKLPERRDANVVEGKAEGRVFDTTLGARIDELTTPKQEPIAPPPPEDKGGASFLISPLRTLKNDLQEVIRINKMSLVRAAALEQEKRHGQAERSFARVGRRRSTRSIVLTAVALFTLGGIAWGVSLLLPEKSIPAVAEIGSSILFAENTILLPLEGTSPLDTKRLIVGAREGGGATLGSITRFIPTLPNEAALASEEALTRPATLEEFLNAIGARAPSDLLRALSRDFFFGVHTVDENAPLFVIPVLSYERAFAGMLAWEEALNVDLAPAFTLVPTQVMGANGLPERRRFEDVVMRNYDVRALKDDNAEIQLYYSFPTRSLLIIGESPYSFTEILNRLRAERRL